jgi:hypothetical protein
MFFWKLETNVACLPNLLHLSVQYPHTLTHRVQSLCGVVKLAQEEGPGGRDTCGVA